MDPLARATACTSPAASSSAARACGLGTAALASLLGRDGLAAARPARTRRRPAGLPHFAPKAKHVIYLFQNGAPTHVDLFDYKPKLKEMHGKPVPESYIARQAASAP